MVIFDLLIFLLALIIQLIILISKITLIIQLILFISKIILIKNKNNSIDPSHLSTTIITTSINL